MTIRARALVPVVALAMGALVVPVGAGPAAAAPATSTWASRAGIPWTAEDVTNGVAMVAQPTIGCSAVDAEGFCTSGVWPRIDGARWIWRTALVTSDEAVNGTVWVTFTDTFTVPSLGTTELQIAADDQYVATLNGTEVASGSMTISTYPVTPVVGLNTLTVRVRSLPGPDTPYYSPAGATWKVTTSWDSTVTLAASAASVEIGDAVTMSATLATGPSNRQVTLVGRPAGGSESVVGSGSVPVSGTLSMVVHPSVTTTYVARFAGEGDWLASESAPVEVRVVWDSSVKLATSASTVLVGGAVSLSATLAPRPTDRRVTLYARPAGGSESVVGVGVVPVSGTWKVTVHPSRTTTYVARYAAQGGWPAAESAPVTVRVLATLTLSASPRVVPAGAAATLTARLTTGSPQRRVLLYASKAGARATLVASRVAPSNGVVTFVVRPLRSTVYTARSAGDAVWAAVASRPATVAVASRWTARSTGGYATSGGYRLYHWSRTCRPPTYSGCPSQVFVLAPAHPRAMVEVTFQYRWGGRWLTHATHRWPLSRASVMSVFSWYDNTSSIGLQRRTMARFSGDASQAAASSAWLYWKVTR